VCFAVGQVEVPVKKKKVQIQEPLITKTAAVEERVPPVDVVVETGPVQYKEPGNTRPSCYHSA
jgi:hypothetical protein